MKNNAQNSIKLHKTLKRLLDFLFAFFILLFIWWLIIILWVISTIDTKKNGMFAQTRIGKNGMKFRVFKIRTMREFSNLQSTVTTADDPRVTKLGRLLRKFKIDELPQIVNVLNGTMSLVGPRATVEDDLMKMNKRQKKRFEVKPGLTGLAQINGNTSLTWPRRIEYDLEYIEKQNFILDMQIIVKTILLIITGQVETHPRGDDEWTVKM